MKICVYGASSDNLSQVYFTECRALGRLMAEKGHTLIFGGGRGGLMGACAGGAYGAGGSVIGIAPRFFDEPGILYKECCDFIYTDTMRERKAIMQEEADGFILVPGGIGSFEEFFETLTLKQLGRLSKPIVILNTENYYAELLSMLSAAAEKGFMSASCLELFKTASSPGEALELIALPEDKKGSIRRLSDYGK